jgi:hypothetical protein
MRTLKKELWPHKISIKHTSDGLNRDTVAAEWLIKKMGTFKGRWTVVYTFDTADYYFKDSNDAVLFSLRWT